MRLRTLGQRLELRGVAVLDLLSLAALRQALARELADHLEHEQAGFVELRQSAHETLIGKLVQAGEHIHAELRSRSTDHLGLFETAAPCKHREAAEEQLVRLVQQVIAPRDRTLQRLLSPRQVTAPRPKDADAAFQTRKQGLRAEQLHAGCGQLDGEGKAVDALADPGDSRGILVGHLEVVPGRHRPLDEELHGLELRQGREGWQCAQVRQAERLDRHLLLPVDVEGGSAAGHHLEVRARLQQLGHHRRALRKQLLEIVEHQQHPLALQVLHHDVERHAVARDRDSDRLGDHRRHQVGVADGRQGDEVDAVGKGLHDLRADLEAEAGLADASRPDQRQQARPGEQALGLGDRLLAPDKAGELRRQVVGRRVQRAERGKRVGYAVDDELVETFRTRQVLQAVQAQVAKGEVARQAGLDQGAGGFRQQDLPTVRGRLHPRRVMHVEADVLVAHQWRLACVQADAHPDGLVPRPGMRGEAPLCRGRGAACVQRALEDAEERIALGAQLPPVAAPEGRAQDLVVVHLRLHVSIAELLHQARRTLDVREQERDRAAGQAHCTDLAGACSSMPFMRLAASRW